MRTRARQLLGCAVLLAGFAVFLLTAYKVGAGVREFAVPFDTDEADHANAGMELYRAAASGSHSGISRAVFRQAFYPPLFSVPVAASYAFFGPSLASSRIPSLLFFVLCCFFTAGAVWRSTAGRRIDSRLIATSLPFFFFASSPLFIENASLCMIELFASALVALMLFRASSERVTLGELAAFSLLIFFAKYNFGLLVIAGVLASFFLAPMVSISAGAAACRRAALFAAVIAAAVLLWFAVSVPASIVHFFVGHPSYSPLWSAENLTFELRSWIVEYSALRSAGCMTLVLALFGAAGGGGLAGVRLAYAVTAASFGILLLSTTNESRHFIVAAPCIWFLASVAVTEFQTVLRPALSRITLAAVLAVSAIGCFYTIPRTEALVREAMEGSPSHGAIQEELLRMINPLHPALFIGVTDQFGIEALRWQGARAGGISYTSVRFDAFPFRDEKNFTALKRMRTLAHPYIDSSFPKEPLDAVLERHYYRSLVLIRRVGERNELSRLISDMKERYRDRMVYSKTSDGLEISAVNLD